MSEINYTCSLGGLCQNSQILKRNNIKFYSYPFDWIFSNCDIIMHCIEDNFNIFLDKSYYNTIDINKCKHSYYDKDEIGMNIFNHFNPLDNPDHYNYYVRCVDRFKNLLKNQEHKLFTMLFTNIDNIKDNIINTVIEFNNKFLKYTSNYTLLVILHIPNKQQNHHIFTYNNNIHFLELHTLSLSDGMEFTNNNDNIYLDNIIKSKYNFNIKINTNSNLEDLNWVKIN
jgi:hypothetical protein